MIKGFFHPTNPNIPIIQVAVAWGQSVTYPHFVLDTGFSGDLKVSKQVAQDLGLIPLATEPVTNMNGELVQAPVALAYAEMEGEKKTVSILILDGMHLAGIGLYTKFGHKIMLDCKNRTIELHKLP